MRPPVAENIVELIGNTPLVRLNKVTRGVRSKVYAKLEFFNPGGSVKDRIGLSMILDAEKKGLLLPGSTIVEPTSGNTGLGLALAGILRGYKVIFTVPDKMSRDKIDLLKAVGARVRVTPTNVPPGHPAHYVEVAKKIAAETPGSFLPNQYYNQANPAAHYSTTGPEVWEQTGGKVDVLVAGVGTGGTITGTGRYLKEMNPGVKVVGVDPAGSILASTFRKKRAKAKSYKIEGIGEDFLPGTLDMNVIDDFVTVTDKEAMLMARRLAREEGILAGTSSGAAVYGALEYAKGLSSSKTVVVILPDTGRSYLNKVFNDDWMVEQGFTKARAVRIGVADLLGRKENAPENLVVVGPRAPLKKALDLMAEHRVTHLPVVEDRVQVGSLSSKDVLRVVGKKSLAVEVEDVMEGPFPTVDLQGTLSVPGTKLMEKGAVLVMKSGKPFGMITTRDVINYLGTR